MPKGLRCMGLMMPIVFALGCAQSYSEKPPPGSLRPGQVKPRQVRCVKRPP
jgi:hypothetical protein